jgi:hypothetical protein
MGFQLNQITPLETIMLVFELLWDIAFAVLILRLAFFYYAFIILTGVILGIVRVRVFVRSHHYGAPIAELIEMLLNLGYSNAQGHTNPLRGCTKKIQTFY